MKLGRGSYAEGRGAVLCEKPFSNFLFLSQHLLPLKSLTLIDFRTYAGLCCDRRMDPNSEKFVTESSSPEGSSLSNHGSTEHAIDGQNLDKAYWYMQSASATQDVVDSTPAELRRLRMKIDWWIVPIMFLCYTMQFLDKVLLNV